MEQSNLEIRQSEGINNAKQTCIELYGAESLINSTKSFYNDTLRTLMCPAYFDSIVCWPPTPANETASIPCPGYILGFDLNQIATRKCTANGQWFQRNGTSWTDYSKCIISDELQVAIKIDYNSTLKYLNNFLPAIKTMSKTGYSISLVTLVIAFIIMISIRKLHCQRNKLHMHLFASFILRAFICLVKDLIFIDGIGLTSDIVIKDGERYFIEHKEYKNWGCKLITSFFQFFITANYSWILIEGLYLYNLIFRALFADSSGSITPYVLLGWGMPFLVTMTWVITRLLTENTYCWTTNDDLMAFLIIRVPTAISILLNLALFVRIAIVIFSKLQAPVYEEAKRYQKWAKSTLVLAPLFGIHYALLIVMSSWMKANETIELIWLISDQLFASFQGFLVAILYCFLNSEVRSELKPHCHAFLTYVATNNCLKHFFPCRHKYLRSARGRTSVCTTMSCSSLFNNGINHRNSRTRFDIIPRNKNGTITETSKNSRSNCVSWQDSSSRRNSGKSVLGGSRGSKQFAFSSNGSLQTERTTCLIEEETLKSEVTLLNEEVVILPKNGA